MFSELASASQMFEHSCELQPVDALACGYNLSILMFGQSGTGQTKTVGTADQSTTVTEESGLFQRTIDRVFSEIQLGSNVAISFFLSMEYIINN